MVGGQKWLRVGWGTGFVALSPRALVRLRPLPAGSTGAEGVSCYDGVPHEPLPGAQRLSVTNGSPFASGALATALEQVESVGVDVIASRIADTASELIARLGAAGVPMLSPTARAERAGIVVAGVAAGSAASVGARLEAAGVTATLHGDERVRLSVHATTTAPALEVVVSVLGD